MLLPLEYTLANGQIYWLPGSFSPYESEHFDYLLSANPADFGWQNKNNADGSRTLYAVLRLNEPLDMPLQSATWTKDGLIEVRGGEDDDVISACVLCLPQSLQCAFYALALYLQQLQHDDPNAGNAAVKYIGVRDEREVVFSLTAWMDEVDDADTGFIQSLKKQIDFALNLVELGILRVPPVTLLA